MQPDKACQCPKTLSAFVASLIDQPWMQHKSHAPAVRCPCGKRYYSLSKKQTFNSIAWAKKQEVGQ